MPLPEVTNTRLGLKGSNSMLPAQWMLSPSIQLYPFLSRTAMGASAPMVPISLSAISPKTFFQVAPASVEEKILSPHPALAELSHRCGFQVFIDETTI